MLLVAAPPLHLQMFAAWKEEVAAVGGFERFAIAAGALALGALVRKFHRGAFLVGLRQTSNVGESLFKCYLKTTSFSLYTVG